MAYRTSVNSGLDKKIFSHTADRTKRVNISPTIMRGGTRF